MARSILLPEFLQTETWLAYSDAIDKVLANPVDKPLEYFSRVREVSHLNRDSKVAIVSKSLFTDSSLDFLNREFLIKTLNIVGFPFTRTEIFSEDQLRRLLQFLAMFWYSKGTGDVTDFLSFVFNSDIQMKSMWTENYVDFIPEGEPGIGASIEIGGTWYPTTHIQIRYDPGFLTGIAIDDFIDLLNEIGNANLVVQSILAETSIPVAQDTDGVTSIRNFIVSKSMGAGVILINEVSISNV